MSLDEIIDAFAADAAGSPMAAVVPVLRALAGEIGAAKPKPRAAKKTVTKA